MTILLVNAHAIEAKASTSYASLTGPERVWYTVTRYMVCVRDGGLISYYYNGDAEHVEDLLTSLTLLGARLALEQIRTMNGLFGKQVPSSLEALNEVINSWPDSPRINAIVNDNNEAEQRAASEAEALLKQYAEQHGIES